MRKILVVLVGLVVFISASVVGASDQQNAIRQEIIAALKENRGMQANAFSKEEIKKFFAPAFATAEEQRNFFNSIDDRLPKKRGVLISVRVEEDSLLDNGPVLTFEMEQVNYLKCIKVLKEGVVIYGETAPGSLRVQR